ncbi:restriction endonuclease subunit S [Microbacterium sp. A196]|uniref:restriction endonuclease subunit S n=1 Tax=Microbacterium sp. A196 TaxID=3457320 RepID=UPI003FD5C785
MGLAVLDCEHKTPAAQSVGVPYIAIPDIRDGRVVTANARLISEDDLAVWTRRTTPLAGDILVTRRGRVGDTAPIPAGLRCAIGQNLVLLRSDGTEVDQRYLRWATRSPYWWSEVDRLLNVGAVFNSLNVRDIGRIRLPMPPLPEQQAIAEVLGALDDKISANTALAATLDEHMKLALLERAADGAKVQLRDVAVFHNRQRVPLSAAERDSRPGSVPYYGATGVFGYVDEAIFDEPIVLVGEDGSVINADSSPVTQYVWGPAWVNNHAHVLRGNGISSEMLFQSLRTADVSTLVTGAVQPKISMGNLKRLQLVIPSTPDLPRIETTIASETAAKRAALDENRTLAATREALLPQLMSGKLRVRDIEAVASAAGA